MCLARIDISEFAVNKLRDRGTLSVTPIVTNVQDFLVHLKNNLGKLQRYERELKAKNARN